jgi:regulator of replication initiation timing
MKGNCPNVLHHGSRQSLIFVPSMTNLSKTMVTKAEQEKTVYTYKVDFASLKSEIQLLEKNDFTMMKAENERLQGEIEKLRQRLREEITRTQANVRLDLNLEKGRIRDEASAQEIKIKETDTRIESEIAGLRTQMEAIKFQILQYMVGKYHSFLVTSYLSDLLHHRYSHRLHLQVPLLVLEHLSWLIYACFDRIVSTFLTHQVIEKYIHFVKQKIYCDRKSMKKLMACIESIIGH